MDNFQLTLAETEIRKHKEALIYADDRDTFNEIFEELDKKLHEAKDQGFTFEDQTEGDYVDPKHPELDVPDYFPVATHSR